MLPNWRGRTVVCIASGPSLTVEDCTLVRASGCPTIVVNTTFRACPWADALFAFDPQWWRLYLPEVHATFGGLLFSQSLMKMRGVTCTRLLAPWRKWANSGACAVAVAIASGASRVLLLGYDCQRTGGRSHHHGDHPPALRNCDTMHHWHVHFGRLAAHAQACGVPVLNCSRQTALECFPRAEVSRDLLDGAADVARANGGGDGVGAIHGALAG